MALIVVLSRYITFAECLLFSLLNRVKCSSLGSQVGKLVIFKTKVPAATPKYLSKYTTKSKNFAKFNSLMKPDF